jgi:hypothetical protein
MSSSSALHEDLASSTALRWTSLADRLNPKRAAFDADLKAAWKAMSKAERQGLIQDDRRRIRQLKERGKTILPFQADPDDHCETSPTAYKDILPLLAFLAARLDKRISTVSIYDPYYCAGGTSKHLNALGFDQVYNQPEDFYQVIAEKRTPEADVLITNPPYSGDHLQRLLDFLETGNKQKPFLLLLPSHFAKRPAFESFSRRCVYLTPSERYHYWTPEGRREGDENDAKKRKKRTHKNLYLGSRNSPFYSYWFVSLDPLVSCEELLERYTNGQLELTDGCKLHSETSRISGSDHAFRSDCTGTGGDAAESINDERKKTRKKRRRRTKTDSGRSNKEEKKGNDDNPFLPPDAQPLASTLPVE